MAKTEFMTSLSRAFGKAGLQLKKHSPEILLGVGLVGVVTSAVMACKATTKVDEILQETKENVDKVHELVERKDLPAGAYTEEDMNKDLAIFYAKAGLKLAKLYAPAVVVGVASITSILASYGVMHKRNVALSAAYMAVDTGFKEYRGRVVERFGEALDRELKYNIKAEEITETVVDENGEVHETTKTVSVVDKKAGYSEFARFFDDGCKGWSKSSERNLKFLVDQQRYANDKLKARGWVIVNEIYEMLGIPVTEAGSQVGWVYDEYSDTLSNYIDFGIFDLYRQENRDFVNGYERVILLDFNTDGNVFELMGRKKTKVYV